MDFQSYSLGISYRISNVVHGGFVDIFWNSPIDFSDIVMLRSGPNRCCQRNLKCFDMPLLSLRLFS